MSTASNEPVSLVAALTAAANATVGVLTIADVFSAEVGGAIMTALAAWVILAATVVRSAVTPNVHVNVPDPPASVGTPRAATG